VSLTATRPVDQVPPGYVHRPKLAVADEPLEVDRTRLKWYEVRPAELDVDPATKDRSRAFVEAEIASGRLPLGSELGFVIRHHCDAVVFVIVSTWRGANELWETVYHAPPGTDGAAYERQEHGSHKGTYCVWELGVVVHERDAWIRYLESPRSEADRIVYLADRYGGPV
jgi:hypothetical protein